MAWHRQGRQRCRRSASQSAQVCAAAVAPWLPLSDCTAPPPACTQNFLPSSTLTPTSINTGTPTSQHRHEQHSMNAYHSHDVDVTVFDVNIDIHEHHKI